MCVCVCARVEQKKKINPVDNLHNKDENRMEVYVKGFENQQNYLKKAPRIPIHVCEG